MKLKLAIIGLLAALLGAPAQINLPLTGVGSNLATSTLTWQWIQDSLSTTCSSTGTSCTISGGQLAPTTAGTVWLAVIGTGNTTANHISSLTGGGGTWCTSTSTGCGCASNACSQFNSTFNRSADIAYNLTGTTGTNSITVTLTQAAAGFFHFSIIEILPPASTTASFDAVASNYPSTTCTTCTGAGLTLGATDFVYHNINTSGQLAKWNSITSPNFLDTGGNGICVNCGGGGQSGGGTAPTITLQAAAGLGDVAIAFKSTSGGFTPASAPFTIVQETLDSGAGTSGISCTPTCPAITLPQNTGSGNLLFLWGANLNPTTISSVSGGGTWVVPAGCQVTVAATNDRISCAYVLSSTSGASSVTVTMSGNGTSFFQVAEYNRTSGSWTLDQIGSAQRAASNNPVGISFCATGCDQPALTGTVDVIVQCSFTPGGASAETITPYFSGAGGGGTGDWYIVLNDAQATSLPNAYNGTAPINAFNVGSATAVAGVAFK